MCPCPPFLCHLRSTPPGLGPFFCRQSSELQERLLEQERQHSARQHELEQQQQRQLEDLERRWQDSHSRLAAYGGGRGIGFGNVMVFNSAVVAMACYTHPSPWTLAWLPLLLIGLYSAQRARLTAAMSALPTVNPVEQGNS